MMSNSYDARTVYPVRYEDFYGNPKTADEPSSSESLNFLVDEFRTNYCLHKFRDESGQVDA